jgi:phosphoribosyl-dephospho-CoA transferase
MSEEINEALKSFREKRRFRHAENLSKVPQIYILYRITVEGNITKSKGCKTVFTLGKTNFVE